MFRKLHIQMTIFCTLVTGSIFLVLTILCLMFAQTNLKKTSYTSFLQELNTTISHLQELDTISHQWLNQVQTNGHIRLYLYDGGAPIYYQQYHQSEEDIALANETITTAREQHDFDLLSPTRHALTEHIEFDFTADSGSSYYTSVGTIPKGNGQLGFIILYSLSDENSQITHLRLIILSIDIAAYILFGVFSWYFTKRMIIPLSENQKKQTLFIASASHELRAPLAVIRSGMEALGKATDITEQRHFLDLMTSEGERMKNLIDDMLMLANSDSDSMPIHMTDCQLDSILLDVYEKYEAIAASKSIRTGITLPDDILPDCCCDSSRITQVLSILIDNAIYYTPENGSIRLSLDYSDEAFIIRVADTGCGVPDDKKTHIFDRFYRADQSHTDTNHFGLGLCIAKEIIHRHDGKLWIEDNPGGGSCFIIQLY